VIELKHSEKTKRLDFKGEGMTLEEYNQLPEGEPQKPIEVGNKYKVKSDRTFKSGDHIYYYEVIAVKQTDFGQNFESILRYSIVE
jgi:hypothetical protein